MADSRAYEPVLSSKAISTLTGSSRVQQKKIISLLFRLAEYPGQAGDYSTRDDHGRDLQHLRLGDLRISFLGGPRGA